MVLPSVNDETFPSAMETFTCKLHFKTFSFLETGARYNFKIDRNVTYKSFKTRFKEYLLSQY